MAYSSVRGVNVAGCMKVPAQGSRNLRCGKSVGLNFIERREEGVAMSIDRNNGARPRLVDPASESVRERDDPTVDQAQPSTNRTRQGVTGHNVRYVLVFGLVGVVLAFILIYAAFSR